MADLSLTGLRVLSEVAARGSFTGAAKTLGYTQSAVSRQIASLEAAAGTPLVERGSRGVRLTEAGGVLANHAGTVLDELAVARTELAGIAGSSRGSLRVGAIPTAVAELLPRALTAFRERMPGVELKLREGSSPSQLRRVISGSADLALIGVLPERQVTRDRRIELEHLIDDPLLLAVARDHPLAGRRTVDLDALRDERWIAASPKANDSFLGAWEWADWQPQVSLIAREWTAKLGLVAAGLGVTLVPGVASGALRPDVSLLRIRAGRPSQRAILIATRAGADRSPQAAELAELLHQTAAEMTAELQRRVGGQPRSRR
jgi:DNA-binding transcriptional LysR family regulator